MTRYEVTNAWIDREGLNHWVEVKETTGFLWWKKVRTYMVVGSGTVFHHIDTGRMVQDTGLVHKIIGAIWQAKNQELAPC